MKHIKYLPGFLVFLALFALCGAPLYFGYRSDPCRWRGSHLEGVSAECRDRCFFATLAARYQQERLVDCEIQICGGHAVCNP